MVDAPPVQSVILFTTRTLAPAGPATQHVFTYSFIASLEKILTRACKCLARLFKGRIAYCLYIKNLFVFSAYFVTFLEAFPSSTVRARAAKFREQIDSLMLKVTGLTCTNINVLLLADSESCSK